MKIKIQKIILFSYLFYIIHIERVKQLHLFAVYSAKNNID
jgi:hypothetical protein